MHILLFTSGCVPFSYMPPERKRSVVISALFRMVRQEKHLVLQRRSKVTGRVMDKQTLKPCSQGQLKSDKCLCHEMMTIQVTMEDFYAN